MVIVISRKDLNKQAFDKAVRQAYDQSNNQVEVSHIMFAMGQDEQDTKQKYR